MKRIRTKTKQPSKLKPILQLLLCYLCTPVMAGYENASVAGAFSTGGNFVFQLVPPDSDPQKTCVLQYEPTTALIMYACQINSLDCTNDSTGSTDHYVTINVNQNPPIELQPNQSYHFSPLTIKALSDKYYTKNPTRGYPTRIQIHQLYCSGVGQVIFSDSDSGMYTASCSSSGCIATSGPIIATIPG